MKPVEPRPDAPAAAAALAGGHPVVIFDGICNLCNRLVQLILDHDRRGALRLCASESASGRALLAAFGPARSPDDTIFLVEGRRLHERSAAALRIARAMGFPWSLLFYGLWLVPKPLRDVVYDYVARHRYRWFGRRDTCRLAQPGEEQRFLP